MASLHALLALGAALVASPESGPSVVLLVEDPSPFLAEEADSVQKELAALVSSVAVARQDVRGDVPALVAALEAAQDRPGARLVVTLGPTLGAAVAEVERPRVPLVAGLALPSTEAVDGPRRRFVAPLDALERDLARLQEILTIEALGVVVDPLARSPMLDRYLRRARDRTDVSISPVSVTRDGQLGSLEGVTALLFTYALSLDGAAKARAFARAERAGVVVMDAIDESVTKGAMLSVAPANATTLRARRIALVVEALLQGREAPTFGPLPERLRIDKALADRLQIGVPFDVLIEAEVLRAEPDASVPAITIDGAAARALAENPGLRAAEGALRAADAGVRQVRSDLLPSASVGVEGNWIDEDRAAGPFPPAERQLQWRGEVRQSLYSPSAWRAFSSERQRYRAQRAELMATRLDVRAGAATRVLDVLRRLATEAVQRENLDRTRINLSLARVRRQAGAASRDEVFRFEIQVAQNKRSLIESVARRNQAEIALNTFLNRDPERRIEVAPIGPGAVLATDPRLADYMDDPRAFRVLRAFAERRALEASPEVKAARANAAAARRDESGFLEALFVPRFDVFATLTQRFASAGAGSEDVGDVGFTIPDDVDWQLGVSATLPLLDGFGNYADLDRARADVASLDAVVREVELAVAGRVRSAMHAAGAARPAVKLTAQAARAADKTLDLVRDAYRRGRVDIIRLVDAQTQSLTTRLDAANATFDFQSDFVAVERAMAEFSFGPDRMDNDRFFRELAEFARTEGPSNE